MENKTVPLTKKQRDYLASVGRTVEDLTPAEIAFYEMSRRVRVEAAAKAAATKAAKLAENAN